MALPSILIVGDDSDIRETMRYVLEEQGYSVYEAAEGAAGLAHLQATLTPTIVLLGVMSPGIDGREMLRRVIADPVLATRHRYIVVTGLTCFGLNYEDRDLLTSLNAPVLPKPFDLEDLFKVVAQASAKLSA